MRRLDRSTAREGALELITLLFLLASALLILSWSYRPLHSATFTMEALPVMLPLEGFHEIERLAEASTGYRWTNGRGVVQVPNPGGATTIQMELAAGPERSAPTNLRSERSSLLFTVGPELRTYLVLLPAQSTERLELHLDSAATTVRNRELGVVVDTLRVEGGGVAPGRPLLALLGATAAAYLLSRRAGLRRWQAGAVVVALQVVVSLWQMAGGWRYALFAPVLLLATLASIGAIVVERIWPPKADLEARPARLTRLDYRVLGLLLLGALCLRLPFLTAEDPVGDLEISAFRMGVLNEFGLSDAYRYGIDYMPIRMYILRFLSQFVLPLNGTFVEPLAPATLVLIKLQGLVGDLATAALLYVWSRRWLVTGRAALVTALYTFAPPVWMNVAWWGQVDAFLMLPMLAAIILLDRAGGRWSWLCWTIALLIKPQAIIVAPVLYAATLRRYGPRGLLQGGALAVGAFAVGCLPLVLLGQGPGLAQAYLGSVGRFPRLTNGAYNLWYLWTRDRGVPDIGHGLGPFSYREIGLMMIGVVVLLVCWTLLRRADGPARVQSAAVLGLGFFLLPTQIHERYLFLSLPFLALRIPSEPRAVVPYVILVASATINILGGLDGFIEAAYLIIQSSPVPLAVAVVNLVVFVVLVGHLIRMALGPTHRNSFLPMLSQHHTAS